MVDIVILNQFSNIVASILDICGDEQYIPRSMKPVNHFLANVNITLVTEVTEW